MQGWGMSGFLLEPAGRRSHRRRRWRGTQGTDGSTWAGAAHDSDMTRSIDGLKRHAGDGWPQREMTRIWKDMTRIREVMTGTWLGSAGGLREPS